MEQENAEAQDLFMILDHALDQTSILAKLDQPMK